MKKPNLVELLPIFRIFSSPFLLLFALKKNRTFFKWLFAFSMFTDVADGFLARRFDLVRPQGAKLDSVGDMLSLLTGFSGTLILEKEFFREHFKAISTTVGLYITQLAIALIKFRQPTSFHTIMAKITMVLQGSFVILMLFRKKIKPLFYITVVAAIIETLEEITLTILTDDPNKERRSIMS